MNPIQYHPEVIIGDCFIGETEDRTIYLSVYCEQKLDLTVRVENRHGIVIQTQTDQISADGDIIKIFVSTLLPGKYSVWIYYHDQVWKREMIIRGSPH